MYNMQGSVYACVYLFVSVSLKHSVIHILLCSPLNSLFLSHSLISFMPRLDKIHEKPFNLNFTTIFRFSSCVSLLVPFRFVSFGLFLSCLMCVHAFDVYASCDVSFGLIPVIRESTYIAHIHRICERVVAAASTEFFLF